LLIRALFNDPPNPAADLNRDGKQTAADVPAIDRLK
jgi:hypothetical protein